MRPPFLEVFLFYLRSDDEELEVVAGLGCCFGNTELPKAS
jgi:hypothetical protein